MADRTDPTTIQGYNPARLEHRMALIALHDFERFAPDAHGQRADILSGWPGWVAFVNLCLPFGLGEHLAGPPKPLPNRQQRRARRGR